MSTFKHIKELILRKSFAEAEAAIEEIIKHAKASRKLAECYFWLGEVYGAHENKNYDANKARDYYHKAVQNDINIPYAYYQFAIREKDPHVKLNYLRIGYNRFPESSLLFTILFNCEDDDNKSKLTKSCLRNKSKVSYSYLSSVVEYLWNQHQWKSLHVLLLRILESESDKSIRMHTELLLGCVYLFGKTNYTTSIHALKDAIKLDVDNELRYLHYLVLTCAFANSNKIKDAIKTFDKITFSNIFSNNTVGGDFAYYISMKSIYTPICELLNNFFKNDKYRLAKLKCLFACSRINDFTDNDNCDLENIIADLRNFISCSYSPDIVQHLFRAYRLNNENINAWNVLLEMIEHRAHDSVRDYINEVVFAFSDDELCQAVDKILKAKVASEIYLHSIVDPIIDKLWKNKKYEDIKNIAHIIDYDILIKSKKNFEIAYSLCKHDDVQLGKRVYLSILQAYPQNSSVLNNLGVISGQEGDYDKSYEYYQRAYQIAENDSLIHNNILVAAKKREETLKQYEAFKACPPNFRRKFLEISEYADDKRCLLKEDIARKTGFSSNEISSIWTTAIESGFVEEINNGKSKKFRINFRIYEYLHSNKELLRSNIDYENIPERLNIDSLHLIGYDNILKQKLQKIPSDVGALLKRDIHECAISIVLGSFKSAILVAGSAVEHILLHILKKNNITNYNLDSTAKIKSGNKEVDKMNLGELLEVALANKLIKQENYHLSQIARQYRNTIHPGNELKMASGINNDTAMMLWRTLLSLVNDYL